MRTSVFTRAITLGAFTLLTAQTAFAAEADTIKYPYKAVGETVTFQVYSNVDPQLVPDVDVRDFKIIYYDRSVAVARSGKNYYCNALKLPDGFDPKRTKVLDSFILFEDKAWASCKALDYAIDTEKLEALDFPFYSDGKVILLVTGERMTDVDVATFKTVSTHQAKDKSHYYFVGSDNVKLPYHHSVNTYPPCDGWGNIDGVMHYEGKPRPDVDRNSFACPAFSTAADKHGFYVGGKPPQAVIPTGVNVPNIKPLTDNILSDGKHVWFVGVQATLLTGLNAAKVRWEDTMDGKKITDGVNSWECTETQTNDDPTCNKL